MEEKRRYRRRYLVGEVKLKSAGRSEWSKAVLMNINKGGIGLYSVEPLKKKEKVSVVITYLERNRMKEVEEIPGIVRWVQPVGGQYAAGIMFEETVNKKNFPIFSKCLEYAKSNK